MQDREKEQPGDFPKIYKSFEKSLLKSAKGLGLIKGEVVRFANKNGVKVPHIGWNEVRFQGEHPMIEALPESDIYYFVHSYVPVPEDQSIIVGRTDYGGPFAAAVARGNIFAVQFHPEKSQAAGKRLLDAYRSWLGAS